MSAELREDPSPGPVAPDPAAPEQPAPGVQGPTLALVEELAGPYVPVDGTFDRIAQMAANVFGAPVATVTVLSEGRAHFAAVHGLERIEGMPLGAGPTVSIEQQSGPFVVEDAAGDERTTDHPLVRGPHGMRFYAAAPIRSVEGQVLGALEVLDRKRRRRVNDTQLGLLADLAATVAQLIGIRTSALNALRAERAGRVADTHRRDDADRLAEQRSRAVDLEQGRERPQWCQLGGTVPCEAPAELKVADSWGDSAWGCWNHAEEALMQVPSVFLASESPVGLLTYRSRH